ncbi:hypothetical protein, partial [Streptomyces sp. NPDC059753]|uniref:hypothetical protein n=1 Tax=Streptomyces sp. NPDC059753 TaxID=3346933 RepID=UPI0036605C21
MNHSSTGNDHLPVYESLVRERGDVVAEARLVAAEAQYQAAAALNGHGGVRAAPRAAGNPPRPPAHQLGAKEVRAKGRPQIKKN